MKKASRITITAVLAAALLAFALLTGFSKTTEAASESENAAAVYGTEETLTEVISSSGSLIETEDLFTDRDMEQEADLTDAVYYTVSDGQDITITAEGVYVISGSASDVTVYVEAAEAKVQIVLDGLTVTNEDSPVIYVKEADKVFVTTTDSESTLTVTGTFTADGDTNTDAVIFSKEDLVLNGTGILNIVSSDNGISGKDDIKVTGGTINISAMSKAAEANDSILIADGTLNLVAGTDALHAENDEDDSLGYIYIGGGEVTIKAGDDGIHATSVLQIDAGTVTVSAAEGLEGTYIQINGGAISISASDDGMNAAYKSSVYYPTIEINGGEINVSMESGDTDAIDSNGYIIINAGTINITANSPFDYDGGAQYNGGTIIVNGQQVTSITNQMMGGAMMGSMNMGGSTNSGIRKGWL